MVSVSPSSLTSVVSWCAPGTGIATVSWSFASYTFTGGDAIAVCFAITSSLADGCKITARDERAPAAAERRGVAPRRPAGPTADGAPSAASRPPAWRAGTGARARRRAARATTRHAHDGGRRGWFAITVWHPLLWFGSRFRLRRRSPGGRAPRLPRPDLALVEPSVDAGAPTARTTTPDRRGGCLGPGSAGATGGHGAVFAFEDV